MSSQASTLAWPVRTFSFIQILEQKLQREAHHGRVTYDADVLKAFWEKRIEASHGTAAKEDMRIRRSAWTGELGASSLRAQTHLCRGLPAFRMQVHRPHHHPLPTPDQCRLRGGDAEPPEHQPCQLSCRITSLFSSGREEQPIPPSPIPPSPFPPSHLIPHTPSLHHPFPPSPHPSFPISESPVDCPAEFI